MTTTENSPKRWENVSPESLIRHVESGRYYAKAYAGGKEVSKSLKTSHLRVAQAKRADLVKEHRKRASTSNGEVSAKMTFGQACDIYGQMLNDNPRIKPLTREYYREVLAALTKSWEGLKETEARKITHAACKKWATAHAQKVSPTRYNNTIAVLRHVLNVAIEAGVIYRNPAAALLPPEKVALP